MKTGIHRHLSSPISRVDKKKNPISRVDKISPYTTNYKKEYLFIKGLNKEIRYFINREDLLNNGLFMTKSAQRIKNIIRRFLKGQERGKLKDISEFKIYEDEVCNLISVKDRFRCYKIRYDFFYKEDSDVSDDDESDDSVVDDSDDDSVVDDSDDDSVVDVYPGFKDIYDVFELFVSKLNIKYDDDSDSDFENYEIIFPDSDSD